MMKIKTGNHHIDIIFTRAGLRWLLPEIRLIEKEKQRLLVIRALDIIKRGGKYYRSKKCQMKHMKNYVKWLIQLEHIIIED